MLENRVAPCHFSLPASCTALAVHHGGIGTHMPYLAGEQAVFLEGVGGQLDLGALATLDKADVFDFDDDVGKQGLAQGGFELHQAFAVGVVHRGSLWDEAFGLFF